MHQPAPAPPEAPPVAHLDLKARVLVVGVLLLIAAAAAFVLYARGAFERTQTLVLVADSAEGVVVGMDLSFAGFPVGRVNRIELSPEGQARIVVYVPTKDAHWLRASSVFTMESGLVGGPRLRAFSGMLSDPPLLDGAVRKVLSGDATADIPRLMSSVRELLANLGAMTADDAPLNQSLRSLQAATARLNDPHGALDRSNALLARLDALALKTYGLVGRADAQVFGERGLMRDSQATVQQLNSLLAEARASLRKVDAVLVDAQAIAGNARSASVDLGSLRAEVEASLRKVEHLVNEVNRRWPFARDTEIKLP